MSHDPVNPGHYRNHPSGVECVQIAEHMTFCLGNAMKYLWRAGLKGDAVEDLKKANWYIEREIQRLENSSSSYSEKIAEEVLNFVKTYPGPDRAAIYDYLEHISKAGLYRVVSELVEAGRLIEKPETIGERTIKCLYLPEQVKEQS